MSEVNTHIEHADHGHDNGAAKKHIFKVFWILLAITVVEIVWGMEVSHHIPYKWVNALFFLSMTFVKAGYIVAEFMHLRHEIKNLIQTVLIPLLLFIWFVIAFCWDGGSWLNLRERYAPKDKVKAVQVEAAPEQGAKD